MYVIKHQDGDYLFQTFDNRFAQTPDIAKAMVMSYDKARNIHKSSISPTVRDKWSIVSYSVELNGCDNSVLEFDWYSISDAQLKLYSDLKFHGDRLREQLSKVDLEICDIQHYIEFFSLDAAKGYKAYKMLKERLIRRREIKDEIAKVNLFLAGNATDFSSGKVTQQLRTMECRNYQPRILNELFGLDEGQKKLHHVS